jgi:hypothetical protein
MGGEIGELWRSWHVNCVWRGTADGAEHNFEVGLESQGLKGFLMKIRSLLVAGVLVSATLAARADSFTRFTLNSSFFKGGTIDGTLTLDTTKDIFTGADLTVSGFSPSSDDGTLSSIGSQGSLGLYSVNIVSFSGPTADLDLFLPVSSLVGFDGSPILDLSNVTFDIFGKTFVAESGSLEPASVTSVTPEPASLLLLATGLLGLAAFWRRRFAL